MLFKYSHKRGDATILLLMAVQMHLIGGGGRLPYDSILVGSIKVGSAKVGSVKDGSAKVGSSKGDGGGSAGHFTWR